MIKSLWLKINGLSKLKKNDAHRTLAGNAKWLSFPAECKNIESSTLQLANHKLFMVMPRLYWPSRSPKCDVNGAIALPHAAAIVFCFNIIDMLLRSVGIHRCG